MTATDLLEDPAYWQDRALDAEAKLSALKVVAQPFINASKRIEHFGSPSPNACLYACEASEQILYELHEEDIDVTGKPDELLKVEHLHAIRKAVELIEASRD